MPRRLLLIVVLMAVPGRLHTLDAAEDARRIISMAPSITETLFTLGLGDQVVGVSDFCNYPPEAKKRAKIGGYFNPSYEAIIGLEPDLVVMLVGHAKTQPALKKLGLKTLVIDHRSVQGILDSFTTIGQALGKQAEAERIVADIKARLKRVQRKTAGQSRPRVLFSVGRIVGTGRLVDVFVAGSDRFFDKILPLAGGQNACRTTVAFPKVSVEGILTMNPQVIVDIVAKQAKGKHDSKTILADWRQVAGVEAVRVGRVYLFDEDFAFVPGPRFILLIEKLARVLHPKVDWR